MSTSAQPYVSKQQLFQHHRLNITPLQREQAVLSHFLYEHANGTAVWVMALTKVARESDGIRWNWARASEAEVQGCCKFSDAIAYADLLLVIWSRAFSYVNYFIINIKICVTISGKIDFPPCFIPSTRRGTFSLVSHPTNWLPSYSLARESNKQDKSLASGFALVVERSVIFKLGLIKNCL
jgi:hypothetical protein